VPVLIYFLNVVAFFFFSLSIFVSIILILKSQFFRLIKDDFDFLDSDCEVISGPEHQRISKAVGWWVFGVHAAK